MFHLFYIKSVPIHNYTRVGNLKKDPFRKVTLEVPIVFKKDRDTNEILHVNFMPEVSIKFQEISHT